MLLIVQIVLGVIAIARGWNWGVVGIAFLMLVALGALLGWVGFSWETVLLVDIAFTLGMAGLAFSDPDGR